MKTTSLFWVLYFITLVIAQAQIPPQAFNYSAIARDANNKPIANSKIGIQISIKRGSPEGTTVYQENHFVDTDDFGVFNLMVGNGDILLGAINTIAWSADKYYLQVGMDTSGGTNFLTMGTTQLLSVPYAFHAETAESVSGRVYIQTWQKGDTIRIEPYKNYFIDADSVNLIFPKQPQVEIYPGVDYFEIYMMQNKNNLRVVNIVSSGFPVGWSDENNQIKFITSGSVSGCFEPGYNKVINIGDYWMCGSFTPN